MPHPMALPAAGRPLAAESDKLTTLFVGAIAPGISDAWIEKLLKACVFFNFITRCKKEKKN